MPEGGLNRTPIVLLADDDPADQELTRRAFDEGEIPVDLRVVDDGEQALDYLNRRGAYSDVSVAPRPDLIVLDLNMPRIDGHQVIRAIRGDARFVRLPIVVMSTTTNIDDVNLTYALGCNTFIRKPSDLDDFMRVVQELAPYWFRLVRLPRS
jgi:CheY-like chemotaxis protein